MSVFRLPFLFFFFIHVYSFLSSSPLFFFYTHMHTSTTHTRAHFLHYNAQQEEDYERLLFYRIFLIRLNLIIIIFDCVCVGILFFCFKLCYYLLEIKVNISFLLLFFSKYKSEHKRTKIVHQGFISNVSIVLSSMAE